MKMKASLKGNPFAARTMDSMDLMDCRSLLSSKGRIISMMFPPELCGTERFAESDKESSAGGRMANGEWG